MKDLKDMKRVLLKLSGEALAGDKKTGFDEATCMQLYQKGMSDIKIGKHFGLSKNPIAAWRARNNLPSNSRSPQARMAFLNGR